MSMVNFTRFISNPAVFGEPEEVVLVEEPVAVVEEPVVVVEEPVVVVEEPVAVVEQPTEVEKPTIKKARKVASKPVVSSE